MTLETFFEKFDQFADAPGAVAKMRELVLELAVQGKLVAQDPNDEPAAEVIKRARTLALRNPRLAKVQKAAEDRGSREGIALPRLPRGWAWTCNADLGDTSPRNEVPDESLVAFAPMNRVPTDYRTALEFESRRWGEVKKGFTHFANGDVAVAKITPCFQNGKACVMANLTGGIGAGTTELHVLRPHPKTVLPLYMLLFFKSPEFVTGGVATFSGTAGQQRVSNDYFRFRPVPLPPLAEQKRIVAKVDELMALCDRLEAQQQERETRHAALARASLARFADAPTPANLPFLFHPSYAIPPADLRKSILTLAVQGKLVESDPAAEGVDDLLAQMQKRRQQLIDAKKIRKPRDLPPVAEDELPFSVPAAWRWTRWRQICDWITYGFTRPMAHVENGPPIVTAKNVQDGFMTFENAHRADATEFADLNPKDLPRKGDILITKDGTIGRAAVVETDEPFCINQSVAVLWLESCLLYRPFMLMVIRSPFAQGPIWQAAEGMAIKHLSITDFGKMIFPLPPLAEQRRIVAKVEQLMALVDALETQLAASRVTAANLLSALVAELTGTPNNGKVSVPSASTPRRRGRPSKST